MGGGGRGAGRHRDRTQNAGERLRGEMRMEQAAVSSGEDEAELVDGARRLQGRRWLGTPDAQVLDGVRRPRSRGRCRPVDGGSPRGSCPTTRCRRYVRPNPRTRPSSRRREQEQHPQAVRRRCLEDFTPTSSPPSTGAWRRGKRRAHRLSTMPPGDGARRAPDRAAGSARLRSRTGRTSSATATLPETAANARVDGRHTRGRAGSTSPGPLGAETAGHGHGRWPIGAAVPAPPLPSGDRIHTQVHHGPVQASLLDDVGHAVSVLLLQWVIEGDSRPSPLDLFGVLPR